MKYPFIKEITKRVDLLLLFIAILFIGAVLIGKKAVVKKSTHAQENLPASEAQLHSYADKVLETCQKSNYKQVCYDKEIPQLMNYITMEEAFQVTRYVQDQDRSYNYCHVLGHELSAREVRKSPDKWKEVVSRCPSGVCSNGCIHGGFQEKFRAESLTDSQIRDIMPDLQSICEKRDNWNPTGLEQASCYHALGHLTMYLTDGEIDKAVELCKEIAIKNDGRNYVHLCNDGSFMQIFQPLEPEDFELVAGKVPKKEELKTFCSQFDPLQRTSCWSEGWPLYRNELMAGPDGLVSFCSQAEPENVEQCFESLVYVLTVQFGFDPNKMYDYCAGLPMERRGRCFAGVASRLIETDYRNIDSAVDLCQRAAKLDPDDQCFGELLFYSDYNFHKGSTEQTHLCNTMPEPWKGKCLSSKNL